MSGVWALVPVKAPECSKSRLLAVLQPEECALLSRNMLLDVLTALGDARHVHHIAVLTDDSEVAELARQLGHQVIDDNGSGDLCGGLNKAAHYLRTLGADTLLIMPGDIPSITADNIDKLLERHSCHLSICPAIRDGGTNALVCTPPDALPFQFGPDSARRHLERARQSGLTTERVPLQAFFRDIDLPADLLWLLAEQPATHTLHFLRESGIAARLSSLPLDASA